MTVSNSQFTVRQTRSRKYRRFGLTLVEIMIALTMTLIVLGAMMQAFKYASEKMQLGRSVMEMANRLRVAEEFLRNDLANLTLDPRPHTESAAPNGFFEIIEGAVNDSTYLGDFTNIRENGFVSGQIGFFGDIDDSIGMTCRSADGQKFRGSVGGAALESTMAEIWYFTSVVQMANPGALDFEDKVRLHRRVLLIRPDFGVVADNVSIGAVQTYIANNDVSVRVVENTTPAGTYDLVANNVADLAVRKHRFGHRFNAAGPLAFPSSFAIADVGANLLKPEGGDILLTDLAGFDIRVYSPNVTIRNAGSLLVEPNDLGYVAAGTGDERAVGGFVDLGNGADGWFSGAASAESQLTATYDTWTTYYEHDGLDQDGIDGIDQGTNGLNDGGTAAFDDDQERETRPPYPYPLRGIKISLRMIEKNTQQVHQTSVIQSYVPE